MNFFGLDKICGQYFWPIIEVGKNYNSFCFGFKDQDFLQLIWNLMVEILLTICFNNSAVIC
jgi:hypothetical protein